VWQPAWTESPLAHLQQTRHHIIIVRFRDLAAPCHESWRAELSKIESFKKRMGWSFKWLSSFSNDFNFDYQASFTPEDVHNRTAFYNYAPRDVGLPDREGCSVFFQDESGTVFHTYSCYSRGIDMLNGAYHYLDLVPKGRDEDSLAFTQDWVRHHDRYTD